MVGQTLLWLKGCYALSRIQTGFRRAFLPFVVPAAASSTPREPAQTLRYRAAALCGYTDESPLAWIPSLQPLGTAARHRQSNFSATPPHPISRSAIPPCAAAPD